MTKETTKGTTKGTTKKVCAVLCAAAMLTMAFALSACGGTNTSQQNTSNNTTTSQQNANANANANANKNANANTNKNASSNQSSSNSLYKQGVFGTIQIDYPSDWKAVESKGVVTVSKDGSGNVPFYTVEQVVTAGSSSTFVANQMDYFKKKYGNQMAKPPEATSTKVGGVSLDGFIAKYSAKDGSATITHEEYVEVVDGTTYLFTCDYVSSASGNQHEDETTHFAFMHTIESMKVKSN